MLVLIFGLACPVSAQIRDEGVAGAGWSPAEFRDPEERHDHGDRATVPEPQRPEISTPENRDTGRPFLDWQHATDDWFGLRPQLDDRGLVFDSSLTFDVSRNFRGGVSTRRTIRRHLLDVNLTVDAERLWGWDGVTLFADFQSFDGSTGDRIVGDYQIFSNIDTTPVTQLPQLWLEHRSQNEALRIKAGLVDANSEFAYTDYGMEFLNSSMGFSPTIFVMPTYPDPSTSVNVFWTPSDAFYLGVGVYDGAGQRGVPTGSRGPRSLLGEKLFSIAETGYRYNTAGDLPGRIAAGAWYHNGDFDTFAGQRQSGTGGWYALLEQRLIQESTAADSDQGLGLFLQFGHADDRVSDVEQHFGAGLSWTGCLPTRDNDSLGVGLSQIRFSDRAGFDYRSETTTELFYKIRLTRWASVTLDLQSIRHPGGLATRRDALVGTTRLMIQF